MSALSDLFARMAPAARERAASDYLAFLLTGKRPPGAHLAVEDICDLPLSQRDLPDVLAALNRGADHSALPTWARERLADILDPALTVLSKSYPLPDHRVFTRLIQARDFRRQDMVVGLDDLNLEPVPEHGEFPKTLDLEAERVSASVETFGRVVRVSRQTLVNDASSRYFSDLGRALTAAAYRLEAAKVYAILEANPNMPDGDPWFATGNTGTGASILAALVDGFKKFAEQQLPSGALLSTAPAVLVMPADWSICAADVPSDLALNRDLRILKTAAVSNGYLVASPAAAPCVGLLTLSETGVPALEVNNKPPSNLDVGMELKCRHDFAVVALSRSGIVRMSVTA